MSSAPRDYSAAANKLKAEIEARLSTLECGVTLADLQNHIERRFEPESSPSALACEVFYFDLHFKPLAKAKSAHQKLHIERLDHCLCALENAGFYLWMVPNARYLTWAEDYLHLGIYHCEEFDALKTQFDTRAENLKRARIEGGKMRQAKLEPARIRAARLLAAKVPSGGYSGIAQAVRVIEPHLVAFIKRRRLSLVCESNLQHTVQRWIRRHPSVRMAYLRKRRKKDN